MSRKGFTLIELMIVVAIIAIIAAIAIPNLLRSRISANEASAIGSMRTISSSEAAYQASGLNTGGFATGIGQYGTLTDLSATSAISPNPFIDAVLGNGAKSGYSFTARTTDDAAAPDFEANGNPADVGQSGVRHFYVRGDGVVRYNTAGIADSTSPPIS